MAYVADINDVTKPLDDDFVGEAAPVEIRAIKQRFITLLADLESYLEAEMLTKVQLLSNDVAAAQLAATNATDTTSNLFTAHMTALGNPHGITKTTIALSNIQNWEQTTAFTGTGDYYATLASMNNLHNDVVNNQIPAVQASINAVADRVTNLETYLSW